MHFLELPRELRDQIYTFTLCPTGTINIHLPPRCCGKPDTKLQRLALFAVCRQVNVEALPQYYSENILCINDSPYLPNIITATTAKHIRAISLAPTPQTPYHRASFSSALARLPQLERLELRLGTNQLPRIRGSYLPLEPADFAQELEENLEFKWLMSMSGLSQFAIIWKHGCRQAPFSDVPLGVPLDHCTRCTAERPYREAFEAHIRAEVTQARAPYGKTPTHLARMVKARKEQERRLFKESRKQFNQRMEMELQHPVKKAIHRELLLRFRI